MRALAFVLAAGCYNPVIPPGSACDGASGCPRGQQCDLALANPVCVAIGDVDAAPPDDDAPARSDAMPDGSSGMPAGAVLWLRMEDDPADGIVDSAGSHAATCTRCPTQVAGRVGMAYDFTADQIDIPDAADLRPNAAFTVAAWIEMTVVPATITPVLCKVFTSNASYCLWVKMDRSPGYWTASEPMEGTTPLALDTWHHLALTWDGTTKIGYVDGVEEIRTAEPTVGSDTGALQIGGYQNGASFTGAIDEVVFYDAALSPAQIAALASP